MEKSNERRSPSLHLMVGLPGSGKSTLAKTWLQCRFVENVVSSDLIRKSLTGDEGDISRDSEVWPIFHDQIRRHIEDGRSVIADATHLTKRAWIAYEYVHKMDVSRFAHFVLPAPQMDLSGEELCELRNSQRTRVVPADAMQRMIHQWRQLNRNVIANNWNIINHST